MGHACAVNCTTGAVLIFLSFGLVPWAAFAASPAIRTMRLRRASRRAEIQRQAMMSSLSAPPAEHKGFSPSDRR